MLPAYGLYNLLHSICLGVLGAFPTVQLPADAMTVFDNLADYISVIAHYIPLTVFIACCSIVFSVWLISAIISAVLQLL